MFLVRFIDEEIHPVVKKICGKKNSMQKKITLSFVRALPQTVTLQLSTWGELEIFCLLLLALIGEYSASTFWD